MQRTVPMAAQRFPEAGGYFIFVQLLTFTLSYQALASLPQSLDSSSHLKLKLPTDDPRGAAASEGSLHRSQFPKDFIFGTGTSAYQVEGAASEGGKGISIWDTWAHTPGKVVNGETADVTVDEYDRYEEDIDLMDALNMDSYRFSIAWTRIFPNGTGPQVNKEGVAYYNRLIDTLLRKGIKPFVTLYHWDLPQALQDSYGGWLSDQIIGDFAAYAEACFEAFGDRVKEWITFNEPRSFLDGYGVNSRCPPGRTAHQSTEPYIVIHNVLQAHGAAVDVYRRLSKAEQDGVIGISVESFWAEPFTNTTEDIEAAHRYMLFTLGWFLDPLYYGDYPDVMRKYVGSRLPEFSGDQTAQLRKSLDFIGLNMYSARYISKGPDILPGQESDIFLDRHATERTLKDGLPIGPQASSPWLYITPWALYEEVKWISERYDLPIYVTENGIGDVGDMSIEDAIRDTTRVQYFIDHISSLLKTVRDGIDVRGYFAWSLMDSFEWGHGYNWRFGIIYVDYLNGLKRTPKDSARWFSRFLDRSRSDS